MLFTLTHGRIYFVAVHAAFHMPYENGGGGGGGLATVAILYRIAFSEAATNGEKIREKKNSFHNKIK